MPPSWSRSSTWAPPRRIRLGRCGGIDDLFPTVAFFGRTRGSPARSEPQECRSWIFLAASRPHPAGGVRSLYTTMSDGIYELVRFGESAAGSFGDQLLMQGSRAAAARRCLLYAWASKLFGPAPRGSTGLCLWPSAGGFEPELRIQDPVGLRDSAGRAAGITGELSGYLSPTAGLQFVDTLRSRGAISKGKAAGRARSVAYGAVCERSQDSSPGAAAAMATLASGCRPLPTLAGIRVPGSLGAFSKVPAAGWSQAAVRVRPLQAVPGPVPWRCHDLGRLRLQDAGLC